MVRFARAGVLVLLLAAQGTSTAQLPDFETKRSESLGALVEDLESYADWCRGRKLFLQRKAALESLLELAPNHSAAHRALGYTKDREGRWVPPSKPKRFKDYDARALEEVPTRYATCLARYLELAHAMLRDPALAPDQRLVLVNDVLLVDPDDSELRELRGEVRMGALWVLWETKTGYERRAELEALVRSSFSAGPAPEAGAPNERDAYLDVAWSAAFATPEVRVLATSGDSEAQRVISAVDAACRLHGSLFELGGRLPEDCTIYLLTNEEEKLAFLGSHPQLSDEARATLVRLSGSGVPETSDIAFWDENEELRIDGVLRTLLGFMFGPYGITVDMQPWIHEGFGLYLTDALIGTRLSWFVQPRDPTRAREDAELRQRLLRSPDWMEDAREVLQGEYLPRVRTLVSRSRNEFTTADLLYSYVFAAYLLETRAQETPGIIRRIGAGRRSVDVIEDVLETTCEELDERIRRWVIERPGEGTGSATRRR